MLMVISPAKTLDFETPSKTQTNTQPDFLEEAGQLVEVLREYSPQQMAKLMKLSDKLAGLNVARYQDWQQPFDTSNAKQALLAFKGDVYTGIDAESFSRPEFTYVQKHLRILSGLYGLLRPLDLIQPYRLEMGTGLKNPQGKDLYQFWGNKITAELNAQLKKQKGEAILVNLASNEYFKSVKPKDLNARIVTPVFKDEKNGQYKIISFYAKKARGLMVAYAAMNKITDVDDLKQFDLEGYQFNNAMSEGNQWVFTRAAPLK
ncbi:MAG: peroxide stress protein YaaA [Gammaproteobacteria bacterium]|nr:MAG: peroxide stress protein YaaA [Gammaproteobacteria bacterium]